MIPLKEKKSSASREEEQLFRELDKGIDNMEQGNTVPHDEAMRMIREKVKEYAI